MNMKSLILAAVLAVCLAATVSGQNTVFTYQGSLKAGGAAASGVYDLQFTLFDASSAGNQISGPVTNLAVTVTSGLFTVQIDFGASAFPGAARWLQVGVRNNGVATNFTILTPRQALTATPYAIQSGNVSDGTVTATKLSPGPGTNGQVLKMNGGVLGWGSGGSVTYIATGPGILGGPITNIGAVSIDTTVIPRLNKANPFTASNYFGGTVVMPNSSNTIVGSFTGDGSGLSNITVSATNTLAGDVTGLPGATTVARIRGVSVATQAPVANQMMRYNGTAWTPGAVALGTDVSGTLGVASGGTGGSTAAAARTGLGAAASGANSDVTSLAGLTTPLSAAQGGSGQGTYAVGDMLYASAATTLSRLADTATGNALISGGAGVAPGWGKVGLTTHVTGTLPLANGGTGGTTGPTARTALGAAASGANSDITSLSGLTTPITLAQGGTGGGTAAAARTSLGAAASGANSDITSLGGLTTPISVAQGGTGGGTAAAARAALGSAASGANSDITALGALTTPLSAAQGGSGQGSYVVGDMLYASAPTILSRLADTATGNALVSGGAGTAPAWGKVGLATHVTGVLPVVNGGSGQSTYVAGDILYATGPGTLSRLPVGGTNQVLSISTNNLPLWTPATNHNHFGQAWLGVAPNDGLSVENTAAVDGASGLTGISTTPNNITYGVFGQSSSINGVGVQGLAFNSAGGTTGVEGEADSTNGVGVFGLAPALTGVAIGVEGESDSTNGIAVYGLATATNGVPIGVYGESDSKSGYGLYTPNRLYVGDAAFFAGHLGMAATKRIFVDAGTSNAPGLTINGNTNCGVFSPGTNIISISTSNYERLRIAADGKIGLGRIPLANALEVAGDASKATAGGWNANSDRRIKTDLQDLDKPLATLDRLHPVSFRYTEQYRRDHPEIKDKTYYNVVAQEFAEVFPESVKNSGEMLDNKPILQVDSYPAMIYSIAAIQELHARLKSRETEMDRLRRQNEALEARLAALENRLPAPAAAAKTPAVEPDAP
jgi:hypothetical protein